MKHETSQHLETAARNRDLARALVDHSGSLGLQAPPFAWAVVVAFYSAVHYVNAFAYEQHGVAIAGHRERGKLVFSDSTLRAIRLDYSQLQSNGWSARYAPGFQLQHQQADFLVRHTLPLIESAICSALGINPL